MLDAMAQRYGVLPSSLLINADTFDITVMDVALTYQRYKEKDTNNENVTDMYDQEQLQDIMNRTRGK
jgi:hypothetical protein